eukprot:g2033.t1
MKTHHDMATGKIVKTQVGPDGNETQLVFDYHNQPGMRRSAVMREQTADFIRNSGKQRGGPPQMTVQVVTQDGRPHYDEDNPYMQRVMQWEGDAQKVRQMTQQKVHDLTKKAQLLVQKFENDVEKDTDMKQYEIPKLSVVAAPLGPESGWHQSRSSTSRPSQNPYMREYYDERAMDNSVSKFSEQTVASGKKAPAARGKPASRMKESGANADEQNEDSDAYSDADTTLTKGARGQCAWDFVPLPAARDSTTSTQEQNNEKKAPSARPSANFGRARRSFNTRGGGSPDQLRSTRGDEDGSASPAKGLRGKPKRASGLIPSKKQSYSPAKQTSDSPSKRKQDSEDDTPTARWTPWGGPFGLGRFGTFDDDDN